MAGNRESGHVSPEWGPSPLDVLEGSFRALVSEPKPLSVHGSELGHGLPGRPIALDELRSMLLHPSMRYPARDEVWRHLVRRARQDNAWVAGAAGIALPGLRVLAGQLAKDYAGEPADIDAEMLAGFVRAVHTIDLSQDRIVARLCYAAYNTGRRFQRHENLYTARRTLTPHAAAQRPPSGHPDFVIARAVKIGVITMIDAELIGRTRLEDVPLEQVSAELRLGYKTAWMRRSRAETRLVEALDGELAQEI